MGDSPTTANAARSRTVDQGATIEQRRFGKAPGQTTAQVQIAAGIDDLDSTNKIAPAHPASVVQISVRPLTARQRAVLDCIHDHIRAHGFPPTIREIGRAMGIRSTNGTNDHLLALERKGYLTRDEMHARSIRLTSSDPGTRPAPRVATTVTVDREEVRAAVIRIEELRDWIPRPMIERFDSALHALAGAMRGAR